MTNAKIDLNRRAEIAFAWFVLVLAGVVGYLVARFASRYGRLVGSGSEAAWFQLMLLADCVGAAFAVNVIVHPGAPGVLPTTIRRVGLTLAVAFMLLALRLVLWVWPKAGQGL